MLFDETTLDKYAKIKRKQRKERELFFYYSIWDYLMLTFNNAFTISNLFCYVRRTRHETGSSIIQHVLCLIFIGLPLVYMRLFLGQYAQLGILNLNYLCPIAHGVGYISYLLSLIYCSHYGLLLADFVMYLIASLDGIAEFTYCPANSTYQCWDQNSNCTKNCISNETYPAAFVYWQELFMDNLSFTVSELKFGRPMPARYVPLIITWLILLHVIIMDPQSIKKIIKVNNYIILFFGSSMIMVCFLTSGSSESMRLMFQSNSKSFTNLAAWSNAIHNVIRMLALERVGYNMYGTRLYSTMSTDMLAIVSVSIISVTAVLCGIVCHAMIGVVLLNAHVGIEGLENTWVEGMVPYFTVFLSGIVYMGVSQLWSIVYFITCIFLISNNLIVSVDALELSLSDTHEALRPYRNYIRVGLVITFITTGVLFSSREGYLILKMMFKRVIFNVTSFNVWLLSTTVFWIYGVKRLSDDIHFYRGMQPTRFWKLCWYFIPCFILVPCIYTDFLFTDCRSYLCTKTYYPVSLALKLPLLICGVYELFHFLKVHHVLGLFQPEERWGPYDPKERHLRQLYNPRKETRFRRRVDNCDHMCLLQNQFLPNLTAIENDARSNFVRPLESKISFIAWNFVDVVQVDSENIFE